MNSRIFLNVVDSHDSPSLLVAGARKICWHLLLRQRRRVNVANYRVIVELNTGPSTPIGHVSACSSIRPANSMSLRLG